MLHSSQSHAAPRSSGERMVCREECRAEPLGQCNVGGIIGREVVPQRENGSKQCLVAVSREREIAVVVQGLAGASAREAAGQETAAQCRRDFDVTERGDVQVHVRRGNDRLDAGRALRAEQVLDQR